MLRVLAALPFAHLAACYLYILFRNAGFKGNIGAVSDVGDLFSVTVNQILALYISAVISFLMSYWIFAKEPEKILGRQDIEPKAGITSKYAFYVNVSLSSLFVISQIISLIFLNKIIIHAFLVIWIVLICSYGLKIMEANYLKRIYIFGISMLLLAVGMICTSAYSEGFRARTTQYSSLNDKPFVCGGSDKLLFTAGSYIIAASKNGARIGYSKDCKRVIVFPIRVAKVDILL